MSESSQNPTSPLLEKIPPPDVIRRRLGETVREAQILRQLLKVSERAERDRSRREVAHA